MNQTDHLTAGQQLPEEARGVLLAMHIFCSRHDAHPTHREIMATNGSTNYDKNWHAIQHLIKEGLVERKSNLASRNLRITSRGRGVVAALVGWKPQLLPFDL